MRFISRGCDLDGNASNTAETEQIVLAYKNNNQDIRIFSFVQTRGSMPFLWQQKPTLKWEPKGSMHMENRNIEVAKKHLDKMIHDYGDQVLVNLIDKKGTQKILGDEFDRVITQLSYPVKLQETLTNRNQLLD
jgi:hypothetical protein